MFTLWLGAEVSQNVVYGIFWYSIMIGFLEEYSKHLVVRFADDNTIYSVDSAITFSIIVALGFAFLENILYFVDRIWLSQWHGAILLTILIHTMSRASKTEKRKFST